MNGSSDKLHNQYPESLHSFYCLYLNDYAVEDASFLRVNNITIGYTFPNLSVRVLFRLP